MRIRWRNIELPTQIICNKDVLTDRYGEFTAEPFEKGFGRTIGNSLRRILLSTIEGCAVTSVKIDGVKHEFSTIPGVLEDVAHIIINIKKICIKINPEVKSPITLIIDVKKKGPILAGDIDTQGNATITNKDLVIANLTKEKKIRIEMEADRGRGYVTAEENMSMPQEIGVIPIASIFSPVQHVKYKIENTRVGKITNYDRLVMCITTDGTISPEMALVEGSKILRKHLNPFVQYCQLGSKVPKKEEKKVQEKKEEESQTQKKLLEKLDLSVETLKLGVRPSNCLASAKILVIKDLVKRTEAELMKIRNFGKTSLDEIKDRLKKLGLGLGMQIEEPEQNDKD